MARLNGDKVEKAYVGSKPNSTRRTLVGQGKLLLSSMYAPRINDFIFSHSCLVIDECGEEVWSEGGSRVWDEGGWDKVG